jgi:hypothetical protein
MQKNTLDLLKGTSKNWFISIYTNFLSLEEVTKSFVKSWFLIKENPQITFVLYRFVYTKLGFCIEAYVEFAKDIRNIGIKKIFSIDGCLAKARIKLGGSRTSIKEFAKLCDNIVEDIFWFGVPRHEKRTKIRSNYKFIKELDLKSRALNNPSFPKSWKNLLIQEQILPVNESLDETKVKNINIEDYFSKDFLKSIYKELYFSGGKNKLHQHHYKNPTLLILFIYFLEHLINLEIKRTKKNCLFDISKINLFKPAFKKYKEYTAKSLNYKNWIFNWDLLIPIFFIFIDFVIENKKLTPLEYFNIVTISNYIDISKACIKFKKNIRNFELLKNIRITQLDSY